VKVKTLGANCDALEVATRALHASGNSSCDPGRCNGPDSDDSCEKVARNSYSPSLPDPKHRGSSTAWLRWGGVLGAAVVAGRIPGVRLLQRGRRSGLTAAASYIASNGGRCSAAGQRAPVAMVSAAIESAVPHEPHVGRSAVDSHSSRRSESVARLDGPMVTPPPKSKIPDRPTSPPSAPPSNGIVRTTGGVLEETP
jgi:hypothetical protein